MNTNPASDPAEDAGEATLAFRSPTKQGLTLAELRAFVAATADMDGDAHVRAELTWKLGVREIAVTGTMTSRPDGPGATVPEWVRR